MGLRVKGLGYFWLYRGLRFRVLPEDTAEWLTVGVRPPNCEEAFNHEPFLQLASGSPLPGIIREVGSPFPETLPSYALTF